METLLVSTFDTNQIGSQEFIHSFRMEHLQEKDEHVIVEVIKRTLMSFPDEGEVLASTLRRLPNFFKCYEKPGSSYLVIKDSAARSLLGGVGLQPFAGLDPAEGIAEIRELVVDTPFRGLGLGRKLLQLAIHDAARKGYKRIYLEATSQMKHAQTLFQRTGFRPIDSSATRSQTGSSFPSYFVLESL